MEQSQEQEETREQPVKKPDETSGIYLQGFVKITDLDTNETIFEGRA